MRWLVGVVGAVGIVMVAMVLCGCQSGSASRATPVREEVTELQSQEWLYEVMRYLYRWHIDERDVDRVIAGGEVVFLVREVTPRLDHDDRSRFGEVVLPQFQLAVKVKRADYSIPELGVEVKNERFKVTSVVRSSDSQERGAGFAKVRVAYSEMREALFRTRNQTLFPEGELLERMRDAVRTQVMKELPNRRVEAGPQLVHLAPLSPVSNDAWVFWESGRMLIRIASDIDLANPAVWDHDELAVKLYDLDKSVVVSLDEVAGSNAFMTRDQAGRVLYNTVVLGRRLEMTPPNEAAADLGAPGG